MVFQLTKNVIMYNITNIKIYNNYNLITFNTFTNSKQNKC